MKHCHAPKELKGKVQKREFWYIEPLAFLGTSRIPGNCCFMIFDDVSRGIKCMPLFLTEEEVKEWVSLVNPRRRFNVRSTIFQLKEGNSHINGDPFVVIYKVGNQWHSETFEEFIQN